MGLGKQLLVALVDGGGVSRVRFALVRGNTVVAEGECAPGDLPRAAAARAVIFSQNSYFDRAETEVRNVKTLPFQARRIVQGALAFNEPFRVRYAAAETSAGRYRLDLVAASEADTCAALDALPTLSIPFDRLVVAETAIAALIGAETDEPAIVLWMRGGMAVGLLVEKGIVLARSTDRPLAGDSGLGARLERMRGAALAAARRFFAEREVPLVLALGELARNAEAAPAADAPSRSIEALLARRFSGASSNSVLAWPELYGLATVPACFSLLDADYQEEARVSRYARCSGGALIACGALAAAAAFFQYADWRAAEQNFETRNTKLAAEYAEVQKKLPTPEQLAALEQRLKIQSGLTDFRIDTFLAWVSNITPENAVVRRMHVAEGKSGPAPAGAATAPQASALAPAGAAPAPQAGAVAPVTAAAILRPLVMTIEWEVAGNYSSVEKLTAALLVKLGARAKLSDSKLDYTAGRNAKFTTVLAPLAGAFRE